MKQYCKTCGFRFEETKCAVYGKVIDPLNDFCSMYTRYPQKCSICNGLMLLEGSIVEVDEANSAHLLCQKCNQLMSTCQLCDKAKGCDFETNPSPLPKTVQKQIRQGNMVMVTEIKNPARTEITCKKNCSCFDEENGCLREFNTACSNFCHIW